MFCSCFGGFGLSHVVATINKMKHDNASILLADGSPIGAQQISVKYKDSSGSIGKMIKAVVSNCVW